MNFILEKAKALVVLKDSLPTSSYEHQQAELIKEITNGSIPISDATMGLKQMFDIGFITKENMAEAVTQLFTKQSQANVVIPGKQLNFRSADTKTALEDGHEAPRDDAPDMLTKPQATRRASVAGAFTATVDEDIKETDSFHRMFSRRASLPTAFTRPKDTPESVKKLLKASIHNNFMLVSRLLAANANPNGTNMFFETPLMNASMKAHLSVIAALLEAKALVNIQSIGGNTALSKACDNGHVDVVEMLLEAKANVNLANYKNESPLLKAVRTGKEGLVVMLLKANGNPYLITEDGESTMDYADESMKQIILKNCSSQFAPMIPQDLEDSLAD